MGSISTSDLIIITPIYEDTKASSRLFRELHNIFGDNIFVIAVDDGSVQDPVEKRHIAQSGLNGLILRLNRNVGHQRAISIGIDYIAKHI